MKKIIITTIILLAVNCAFAQWTQTNGPNGSVLQYSASTGTNIYATSYYDGIYLSSNSGSDWININPAIPSQFHLYNVAAAGNDVFVVATDGNNQSPNGIYHSTNKGTSWTLAFAFTPSMSTGPMIINNGRIICSGNVGNAGNGFVLYSSDNGLNWMTVNIPNSDIFAFAANGNTVYAGGYKMYISQDNGSSWSILSGTPTNVQALVIKNNTIIAGCWNDTSVIYQSTNNGISWNHTSVGIPSNRRITSLSVLGNDVYASAYVYNDAIGGIYKSTDNGNSWVPCGLASMWVDKLGAIGNNLYSCTAHGIFISTDSGLNWATSNTGFPFLTVNNICYNGSRMFIGGAVGGYFTTNAGNNWLISTYPYGGILAVAAFNNRVVMTNYKSASYSLDNGQNWNLLIGLPAGVPRISTVASTSSTFLVSQYTTNSPNMGYVCVTSDNGANWKYIAQPTSRVFVNNGSNIFSATSNGVYRSTNNGFIWTQENSGLSTSDILTMAADGNNIVAGTNGSGPFLSTNSGTNWVPINSGISNAIINSLAIKGNKIFAGSNLQPNKIFMSANLGTTWIPIDENLSNFSVNALSVDSNYLYAATSITIGVWKRSLNELTGIEPIQNNIPDKFSLSQNYPNPFNPSTKISYDLPVGGFVSIVIYDVLGREVKTLVNEKQNAGSYELNWDASNSPSGVYLYKITSGDFSESKKMILLK